MHDRERSPSPFCGPARFIEPAWTSKSTESPGPLERIARIQGIPLRFPYQPLPLGEARYQPAGFEHLLLVAQHGQGPLHADPGALQRGIGVQHDALAGPLQHLGAEDGRPAADHHVHQLRRAQPGGQGAHLLGLRDGFDEQDVRARLIFELGAVGAGAFQRAHRVHHVERTSAVGAAAMILVRELLRPKILERYLQPLPRPAVTQGSTASLTGSPDVLGRAINFEALWERSADARLDHLQGSHTIALRLV